MFPQLDSIDGRDWTQIKIFTPTASVSGVAGNSCTVLQTISSVITAIVDTNQFAQEQKEQCSNLINVRRLPADVLAVYEKVNTHRHQITKAKIKKFANVLTTDPADNTVYEHNFVQFRRIPRLSPFTRMEPHLKCSNIFTLLQKILTTLKSR